jgi:hypothetical protein
MKAIDKLGREIVSSNFIAYGHNLGRCAGLRLGVVIEVRTKANEWSGKVSVNLLVIGIDDDYSPIGEGGARKNAKQMKPLPRKSTLLFPERTVIVPHESVPRDVVDALWPIYMAAISVGQK